MKNKTILAVLMILVLALLSSCAMIPVSQLDAMFRTDGNSVVTGGGSAAPAQTESAEGDMVTIRREEYEKLKKFSDALTLYEFANTNFYEETDPDRLIEYASRGVLAGLEDPYSFYYNPEEFKDMWEEDEGSYVGIGVQITSNMNTQLCTISRVFKGGPAEEVGVLRGDILYRVGEDLMVTASNVNDAVDIMRGEPNTDVDVTFLRDGEEITFTITRREVNVNQIESTMLGDGIGYIALYQFAGECEKEFESELNRLVSEGAEGIILDLRDNPGGWVDQARYIADLFMDEGEICYLVYRDGIKRYDEYRTKNGKTDVKLVVLINENSASSSEILTGALQERAGAKVVGVKSFGKGIIQGVYPIGEDGAGFQLTIAQYFTPDGHKVHEEGIMPDIEVPLPEGDNGMYEFADVKNDIQLSAAMDAMKEQLEGE